MASNLSQVVRQSKSLLQPQICALPPIFLLRFRARLTTVAHTTSADPPPIQPSTYSTPHNPPTLSTSKSRSPPSLSLHSPPTPTLLSTSTSSEILDSEPWPTSTPDLLPHLAAQPPYYITAHIHNKPYLLTEGDTLRLPSLLPDVLPGQILRLTRASVLGSRDYTLKGAPWIDERSFICRARVLGTESEPMRTVEKTKRRQRRVQKVHSKHKFTILKIVEVKVEIPVL